MKWFRELWLWLTTDHRLEIAKIIAAHYQLQRIDRLRRLRDEQKAEIAELKRRKKKFSHLEPGLQATVNELLRLGA